MSTLHMNLVQVDFFPGGGARAQEHSHSVSLQLHLVLFRISNVFLCLLSKRSYTFPFLESGTVYDVIGLGEIKYDTFISYIQSQRSKLLGSVVT